MAVGIVGTKLGMTQVFDEQRRAIPVTVIQAGPCPVTQVKTKETDGYSAIQIGYGECREKSLSKPELGHLKKSDSPPLRHLIEYRVDNAGEYTLGQQLDASLFEAGQTVDVIGTSIGRGFAGFQKRHNFARGPMSHGSKNHREPGSTGAGTTPGRVYPGKKMAGRLGGTQTTVKKLTIIRVDTERNVILIKGAVPGKPGALVQIVPAKTIGGK
ncbi:50S ribosomal protein L3 [Pseudanabaenaceae cyanobacterium LEGE 13415]|nr:50S ribosomal protein L3 [Pseudanabaenaceae cyanobacterium LEGE 13415]